MQRVVLALVLASTFVVLSAQPVEAQSRAVQPRAGQPPAAELSQWETATLVRLMNLLEVELTRRSRTGDLVALRHQLTPAGPSRDQTSPIPPSVDDAPRRRSKTRTWGGIGLIVAGALLVRQRCDGIRLDDNLCLGSPTWWGGSTIGGLGVSTLGVLLATVWADTPVAASIDPSRRTVAFTRTVSW